MPEFRLSVKEKFILWISSLCYHIRTRGICVLRGCKVNERGFCDRCGATIVPYLDGICGKVLPSPWERFFSWLARRIQVGHKFHGETPVELLLDLAKDCREMAGSVEEETQKRSWENMAANLEMVAKKLKEG